MANDINNVVIIGNLTADCGSKERDFVYTQGGMCIATISLAVNRSRKLADGTWGEETSFFDVHVFGKTAENLKPYLTKGKKIAVQGYLKQERWEKDGQKLSKVVINADYVELLGGGQKEENSGFTPEKVYTNAADARNESQNTQRQNVIAPNNNGGYAPDDTSGFPEDIPF